jgi:hypothetical protein
VITERIAVREAARRLGVKDDKWKARRRSLRWMQLGWEGATTAAQEEARKEAILEMLRALVEDSRRGVKARVFVTRWESLW